jgi:hypothetical protein
MLQSLLNETLVNYPLIPLITAPQACRVARSGVPGALLSNARGPCLLWQGPLACSTARNTSTRSPVGHCGKRGELHREREANLESSCFYQVW